MSRFFYAGRVQASLWKAVLAVHFVKQKFLNKLYPLSFCHAGNVCHRLGGIFDRHHRDDKVVACFGVD